MGFIRPKRKKCCAVLCLILAAAFLLPAAAFADPPRLAPGEPIEFRGVRFLPVGQTDDPDLIPYRDRFKSWVRYFLMIRVRCVDGAISAEDADAFAQALEYCEDVPGKTTYLSLTDSRVLVADGDPVTEFDVIVAGTRKADPETGFLCLKTTWGLYPLQGLPELDGSAERATADSGDAPALTLAPSATPIPTAEPTAVPRPQAMTGAERETLVDRMKRIMDDKTLTPIPMTSGNFLNPLKGKLLIAVFSGDAKLGANTLDDGYESSHFRSMPENRMAFSFGEADTLVFIYPVYELYGTYSNGSKGYTTYTRMAVVSGNEVTCYTVARDEPPQTITVVQGMEAYNSSGKFDVDRAMLLICEQLRGR